MLSVQPMISLGAFIIGFVAVLVVARLIAEYVAHRQRKSPQDVDRRQASASQKTLQRYYNTRRGA